MSAIKIRAFESTEVEVGEYTFKTCAPVRSAQRALLTKLDGADRDSDDPEVAAGLLAEVIDARLEGVGHKRSAKTILLEMWKSDQISIAQLQYLIEDIGAAENPT